MTVQAVLDEIRKRPGTGDVIPVIDPATEEQITEFTDCGPEAVNDAVARAKATVESGVWSGLPDYERAKILWRIADLIDENAEILAELDSLNTGMYADAGAVAGDQVGAELFRYYAGWCTKINGIALRREDRRHRDRHRLAHAHLHPQGALRRGGPDLPVERPGLQLLRQARAALAAGCSSVVKPAEETPLSALLLTGSWPRPGCPRASSTW